MEHYKRGFLNEDEGVALYETRVKTSCAWRNDGTNDYVDASLVLGDCSRRIYLEFDAASKKQLEQRKQKVALLLQVVQEFHDKFMEGANSLVFKEEE